MLGFQLSNYEIKPKTYRELNGQVASDSLVKVSTDENEEILLSTYDGYYSLNDLSLSKDPKSIKLEEVKADGTCETIYEKNIQNTKTCRRKRRKNTQFSVVLQVITINCLIQTATFMK